MQAYTFKGTVDDSGHLTITEPIQIPPGEVEVIVLRSVAAEESSSTSTLQSQPEIPKRKFPSKVKAFQNLFEDAPALPSDFDPEEAKWEYLKEKHNL